MTNQWWRFVWLLIGINWFQMQKRNRQIKDTTSYVVIVSYTFYLNVNWRTILSSLSLMLIPHSQESVCSMGQAIDSKKRKVVAPPQESCTFANNEIANNSSMSCCKIMMHLIFSKASSQTSCVDIMLWIGNDTCRHVVDSEYMCNGVYSLY